jgi:hypothetical protein
LIEQGPTQIVQYVNSSVARAAPSSAVKHLGCAMASLLRSVSNPGRIRESTKEIAHIAKRISGETRMQMIKAFQVSAPAAESQIAGADD